MNAATPALYPKLPFEVEAEQSCLGGCLISPAKIPQVIAACSAEDFYEPLHRRIASAIFALDKERRPVTPLTVKTALGDDAGLAEVGGHGYLANMASAAADDPVNAARLVSDVAARRAAMMAIWDAQEILSRGEKSITDILKPVIAAADRAAERDSARAGSESAGDAAYALLRSLEQPDEAPGVPTGLNALDEMLGGLSPGNLYVLAGRPGAGKSAVACSMARYAAQAGAHAEYYSLEMPRRQLSARMVCDLDYDRRESGAYPLQYSKLLRRKFTPYETTRAMEAQGVLRDLPITIHDRDSMTMADIAGLSRARATKLKGPGVVIIDHLHFLRPDDRYRGNQTQELGECAKAAKRLARALGWPVLLLAQLNRQVESRPEKERMPTLADLRQSGEIEEAADVVMFLHRPAYYVERRRPRNGSSDPEWGQWLTDMDPVRHRLDIDIAKHRNGETGLVQAHVEIGSNSIRDQETRLSE
jgi:replicative DNA helicase